MIQAPKTIEEAVENGLSQSLPLGADSGEVKIKVAAEIVAIHIKEYLKQLGSSDQPLMENPTFG